MTTAATLPGFLRSATAGGLPLAQAFAAGAGVRLTGSTSGTVDMFPPATVTTPYTLTLPAALGASDKIIQVSSTGVLSLVDPVSPAGTGTEIQYRNSTAFGAVTGSSWDATTLTTPKLAVVSTTANQFTVGYDATYKVTLDVSSAGVLTLAGFKPSGSNVAAGSAYIDVPVSTGNATPGSWIVRSTVAGTSGSTAQTLSDTLTIARGNVVLGASSLIAWAASCDALQIGGYGALISVKSSTVVRLGSNYQVTDAARRIAAAPVAYYELYDGVHKLACGNTGSVGGTFTETVPLQASATAVTIGVALTITDAVNVVAGTTTGTKIGTATTQKLGMWNATPIVQPTTGYAEATLVQNSGDAINDNSTFDGYTLRQVVAALRGMGALA